MTVRLETGASITLMKRVVGLHYTLEGLQYDDDFIVLDMNDQFDVIVRLPWLKRYELRVSWQHLSVKMPAAYSSDGHLMNVLVVHKRVDVLRVSAMASIVVRLLVLTAQDRSVANPYTVDQAPGGCTDVQAAPKVHHSKKSSGSGHGCTPSGRYPRKKKLVATKGQHDDPRSTG